MPRLHRLIALLLAALWLPAVWHCGMETLSAAVEEQNCCSHDSEEAEASEGACVADHCGVFDDGHYRVDGEISAGVPAPMVLLAVVPELWRAAGVRAESAEPRAWPRPPMELSQRWMFELRAAPQANAPGLMAG